METSLFNTRDGVGMTKTQLSINCGCLALFMGASIYGFVNMYRFWKLRTY